MITKELTERFFSAIAAKDAAQGEYDAAVNRLVAEGGTEDNVIGVKVTYNALVRAQAEFDYVSTRYNALLQAAQLPARRSRAHFMW